MNRKQLTRVWLLATLSMTLANTAQAANPCLGAVGTWSATYTIISTWTDVFSVKSVSKSGTIIGENEYGDPMHGFCKKGVLYIAEDQQDYYLAGYYFLSTGAYGQHSATTDAGGYAHDVVWFSAEIKRVDSASARSTTEADPAAIRYRKAMEQIEARPAR